MTISRAAQAAKFLRDKVATSDALPSADARDAAIIAIERAILARGRRKRMNMILGVVGSVAAAAIAVVSFKLVTSTHPSDTASVPILAHVAGNGAGATLVGANKADPSQSVPLSEGTPVSRGQRVITPANTNIVFAHATGTELTLHGSSEMAVVDDSQSRIYSLGKGLLDLRVAKLQANERLLVRTSDAEVEVRGTRFHVEVLDPATSCDGRATRVSVDEGVVVVRRDGAEVRLTAGQSWPTCTQTAATPIPTTTSDPAVTAAVPGSSSAPVGTLELPAAPPKPQAPMAPSTLAEENDLYADGIAKKRQHDMAGAAAAFERLLAKYPQSRLAEDASAERLKALKSSNPARAKIAAREYLDRFPRGFARDEAESVLREAP